MVNAESAPPIIEKLKFVNVSTSVAVIIATCDPFTKFSGIK